MSDINQIKPNLEPNYFIIIGTCLLCLLFLALFIYIVIRLKKAISISRQKPEKYNIVYDRKMIEKALQLLRDIKDDIERSDQKKYLAQIRQYYHRISKAIRLASTPKIQANAVNMTKTELIEFKIHTLDDLLIVCYQVQFSKIDVDKDYSLKIVNLAIDYVKKCF